MPREVVSPQDIQPVQREVFRSGGSVLPTEPSPAQPPASSDDYMGRLIKYVPTEVVTFYAGAQATLPSLFQAEGSRNAALWILFFVGLIGTPLYLWRLQNVKKTLQLLVSTGAFLVWAFALGDPLASALGISAQSADQTGWAFLIVAVYTFIVASLKL